MVRLKQVDEVHLWDFIPRSKEEGRKHLESLAKKYPFITLKFPRHVPMFETYWHDKDHSLEKNLRTAKDGKVWLDPPNVRGYSEYYK